MLKVIKNAVLYAVSAPGKRNAEDTKVTDALITIATLWLVTTSVLAVLDY